MGIPRHYLLCTSREGHRFHVSVVSSLLTVVQIVTQGRMKEVPEWFPGAKLNYAENILRHDGDSIAITGARETGPVKHVTFRQLRGLVREMAAAMRVHGLQKGDRVAGAPDRLGRFTDS